MLIERVTIIIHNAANVKFNDSLKYAILTNTRSTRDICILAENVKNLIALVYVGTAYTHLDNPFIEEKVYPSIAEWRKMIKVAESLDEHNLSIFTAKCLDYIPNTYLFSKNLAESIIHEYSSSLPCAIVRPSIVTNSLKDPIPGWVDNFNGPVGLTTLIGKGLLRVIYANNCISQNHIPIDIVINTIILVTWKLGLTTFTPKSTFLVVNCSLPHEKYLEFQASVIIFLELLKEIPMEGIVWIPGAIFTKSLIIFYVLTILLHILPAIIIDSVLKFTEHQSMILGLQRKAYVANYVLHHFMSNEWKFDNTNSRNLMSLIPSDDREIFSIDLSDLDWNKYFRDSIISGKKYLLHEDMNRLKAAKAHYKRMDLFVRTFKTVIIIGILWMIYKCM